MHSIFLLQATAWGASGSARIEVEFVIAVGVDATTYDPENADPYRTDSLGLN